MTDPKTLRHLMRLMVDNGLTELRVESEGEKILLKRGTVAAAAVPPQPALQDAAKTTDANPSAPAPASAAPATTPTTATTPAKTIPSPMVGTFYAAASPDAAPFVKPGDPLTPDTVVCIIEAMKVFNEIKAETTGTLRRTLVESGQGVEFDQPLFEIE